MVCIDSQITFHSFHYGLIDQLISPLEHLLPAPDSVHAEKFTCVVARTIDIPDWPSPLLAKAKSVTPVDNMTMGETSLVSTGSGMTLVTADSGAIYHSGDGRFLCLVPPPDRKLAPGEFQNIYGLATALTGEILLLTDKLLVHAGAVGNGRTSQIWTGESGSGKTTQIIKIVAKGWDFFGEDQIITGKDSNGQFKVWPFWRQIKASAETAKYFPAEQDLSQLPADERNKYSFENISEVLQVTKPQSTPLTAIYKIRPGNGNILRKLDFNEAFQQVSPEFMHSLFPGAALKVMDIVLDIVSEIPVFQISWDRLEQFQTDHTTA